VSRKFNKPFILELHGLSQESSAGVFRSVKTWYIEQVDRKLLRHCDHIITLTQSLREWLISSYKLPESKITVIPNGADIEQFSPRNDLKVKAEELREKLGVNGKIIMYAGCMDRINGMEDLARVIPQIIQERQDICFLFIGQHPEEKRLIALFGEYPQKVKFLSTVPYDEMPIYYQLCDVFVIPRPSTISAETLTPLKLLEVMAVGKPVLGSNVGGITEVIKHRGNGYLFEKGNMKNFKETLLEALDVDNRQIGKNARKTVVENYTWDKSAEILRRVYEGLV